MVAQSEKVEGQGVSRKSLETYHCSVPFPSDPKFQRGRNRWLRGRWPDVARIWFMPDHMIPRVTKYDRPRHNLTRVESG
jgi:hypothetical protein